MHGKNRCIMQMLLVCGGSCCDASIACRCPTVLCFTLVAAPQAQEEAVSAATASGRGGSKDAARAQPGGPGLLSQALKLPGGLAARLTSRALSLSNLLDVGIDLELDAIVAGTANQGGAGGPTAQLPQDEAESQVQS